MQSTTNLDFFLDLNFLFAFIVHSYFLLTIWKNITLTLLLQRKPVVIFTFSASLNEKLEHHLLIESSEAWRTPLCRNLSVRIVSKRNVNCKHFSLYIFTIYYISSFLLVCTLFRIYMCLYSALQLQLFHVLNYSTPSVALPSYFCVKISF